MDELINLEEINLYASRASEKAKCDNHHFLQNHSSFHLFTRSNFDSSHGACQILCVAYKSEYSAKL